MESESLTSNCLFGSRAGSLKRSRESSSCPAFSTAAADAQQAIRPPAYGKCVIARERSSSEDHWVQDTCVLGPLREPVSIFAVFDGHGGDGASKHSVQRLIHHLQQHLAEQLDGLGPAGVAAAPADAFIEQALHAAFHQTDKELADTLAANCGTTATVAVVSRHKIFLAWAGKQCVLAGTGCVWSACKVCLSSWQLTCMHVRAAQVQGSRDDAAT
jgi:hypothetical protein